MWGRPSPASDSPARLRVAADAASAAVRADGGDSTRWVVRAASISGVRHRLAGIGPQDAYAWATDGERLVVAVADGVSGRPGSEAAAAAAARAAVASPGGPIDAADEAVRAAGGATTLVVATVDPGGEVRVHRVGDSTALVLSTGRWHDVWAPGGDDAEPIRTATEALPSEGRPGAEELALGSGDVLVLCTDGVAGPLHDGPATVAPALAAALAAPPDPLDLARILGFSRQGCHDDRTLLAVWTAPDGRR